jgi:hypothetical protein
MITTAKTFTHPRRSLTSHDVTPALTRANSSRLWLILRKCVPACRNGRLRHSERLCCREHLRDMAIDPDLAPNAGDSPIFSDQDRSAGNPQESLRPLKPALEMCPPPSRGSLKKGAFDPPAKFAAIDAPSFRPFFRISRTFKDTGESAARSMIFREFVGRGEGIGPPRAARASGGRGDAKSGHGASTILSYSRDTPKTGGESLRGSARRSPRRSVPA